MNDNERLDKQANVIARQMIRGLAWPTIALAVTITSLYILTLTQTSSGRLGLWWAYLIVSSLTYTVYTVLHEAVHGSIHGRNKSLMWVNSGLGFLAGQILFISFKAHQNEHLAHHRNTNLKGLDPDLYVDGDRPIDLIRGAFRAIYTQYDYFFRHSLKHASHRDKLIVTVEVILMVGWRLAFVLASSWAVGLVLFVLATLTGLLLLVVLFVWLVHRPNESPERYKNTNTILLPKQIHSIGTWVWLFQNYHSVHHLFPKVPFYKYRKLFEEIEPVMIAHRAPIIRWGASK